MLHGEGVPKLRMDSLLKKYSFVHHAGERFAVATSERFLCVNPHITDRMRATYPGSSEKIDTLWTWVNTDIFKPGPFPASASPFRIAFAGRLDEFKVPPLMFKTIERLKARLPGRVEFHYIGTSNPARFPEFAAIEDVSTCHGFKDAAGMAATLGSVHAGILTSEFEGMPRCVLETLAVGRPVVAMHLPQLETVIREGQSGFLVSRGQSMDDDADNLARKLSNLHDLVTSGRIDPFHVASHIDNFTPRTQLAKVFRLHHDIQDARRMTGVPLAPEPQA
jgi:glycosyltransferase involved in cell wall biosynthesis